MDPVGFFLLLLFEISTAGGEYCGDLKKGNNENYNDIIFISERKNWTEARQSCRDDFLGHLATFDLTKETDVRLLQSCVTDGNAWFGNYSIASPPIAIVGCYKEDISASYQTTKLKRISASACERKCNGGLFAVQGKQCGCLKHPPDAQSVLSPLQCEFRCDQFAFCGGNRAVNVYHSRRVIGNNAKSNVNTRGFNVCGGHFCYKNRSSSSTFGTEKCANKQAFSCGSETNEGTSTWFQAQQKCLTDKNSYLPIDLYCLTEEATAYWNGYFSSEEFIMDDEEIAEVPQRATVLHVNPDGVSLFDPILLSESVTISGYLCATDKDVRHNQQAKICSATNDKTKENGGKDETTRSSEDNEISGEIGVLKVETVAGISVGGLIVVMVISTTILLIRRHGRRSKQMGRNATVQRYDDEKKRESKRSNVYSLSNGNTGIPRKASYGEEEARTYGIEMIQRSPENLYNAINEGAYDKLNILQKEVDTTGSYDYYSHATFCGKSNQEDRLYDTSTFKGIDQDVPESTYS